MHDEITWPRYGKYRCVRCRRQFLVPWMTDPPRNAPRADLLELLRAWVAPLLSVKPLEAKNAGPN
jgi:hypothetical protein